MHPERHIHNHLTIYEGGPYAKLIHHTCCFNLTHDTGCLIRPDLFVTLDNRTRFLKINTIACIWAAGDYTQALLTDGHTGLVIQPLKAWEARLPDKHFARIHRSMIINFDAINRPASASAYTRIPSGPAGSYPI